MNTSAPAPAKRSPTTRSAAVPDLARLPASKAAKIVAEMDRREAGQRLSLLHPTAGTAILQALPDDVRDELVSDGPSNLATWMASQKYPVGTVGRLMESPVAVFQSDVTVSDVVEHLRELVRARLVTYCWVVDGMQRLVGVVAMRELLLARAETPLDKIMVRDPFRLSPIEPLKEAMKEVVTRHYPIYPVCDRAGVLVGAVRGRVMFETQTFEISAQPGVMVGVEKEERVYTPWSRSFRSRHPWLQLNLLTAFIAGGVVSIFQDTIDRVVLLAVFLPILAGQSGNTGCQALAVTLRGLTLGDLSSRSSRLILKEALLGLVNGALVGVTAGAGMFVLAKVQKNPDALKLAILVVVAMIGSCVVSGITGAIVPLSLKKLGADPATASSIFLTTATDVVSMGLLLALATLFV